MPLMIFINRGRAVFMAMSVNPMMGNIPLGKLNLKRTDFLIQI